MKNLLYAVQVSNTTLVNGETKWLLRNDACLNLARGIISCLLEKDPDLFVYVKLPRSSDTIDCQDGYDILFEPHLRSRIAYITHYIPISPVTSRFHFDIEELMKHRSIFSEIDVMINDENTLTKNWNVFFDLIGNFVPIISTNYFLDSPIAEKVKPRIRYYERQMKSFINSDIAAFQCEAGRIEAFEAFEELFKSTDLIKNWSVWGVGVHAGEILKAKKDPSEAFETPTVYFGNRITETAGRYTNYDKFAEAIGKVFMKYPELKFEAVMLNPTRKASNEQLELINRLSRGKVRVMSNDEKFSREDYLDFINRSHVSVNLFVTEVHGGVTHAEAMLAGNVIVCPNINNYKTKFDRWSGYPFLVEDVDHTTNRINTDELAERIHDALLIKRDDGIRQKLIDLAYETESYEMAAVRILADIEHCMTIKKGIK